jgi:hypothetical protein
MSGAMLGFGCPYSTPLGLRLGLFRFPGPAPPGPGRRFLRGRAGRWRGKRQGVKEHSSPGEQHNPESSTLTSGLLAIPRREVVRGVTSLAAEVSQVSQLSQGVIFKTDFVAG